MRKGLIEFRGRCPNKTMAFTYPFNGLLSLAKILFKAYKNKNHTMLIIHWDK